MREDIACCTRIEERLIAADIEDVDSSDPSADGHGATASYNA